MALSANVNWYVWITGVNTSGGGFDSSVSGAGTNYANQAAAQLSINNSSVVATSSGSTVTFTSGYTPTSADIGNTYRDQGQNGSTAGYYTITGQTSTTWTLDRAIGTSTGLVGAMGGAFATLLPLANGGTTTPPIATPLAAGHTVNIRGSGNLDGSLSSPDYDFSSGYWTFPAGTATSPINFVGVNGRPCIKTFGLLDYTASFHNWSTCKFFYNASPSYTTLGILNGLTGPNGCSSYNCILDQNGVDGTCTAIAGTVLANEFRNTGSTTAGSNPAVLLQGYPTYLRGNFFHLIRGDAIAASSNSMANISHNIIYKVGRYGIYVTGLSYGLSIANNTIDGGSTSVDGIRIAGHLLPTVAIMANILANLTGTAINDTSDSSAQYNHANYGQINYNGFYNVGANYPSGFTGGANDVAITAQPFVTAGSNWGLNNNAGGGAACRAAAWPGAFPGAGTTGYIDLGAVQHQDSGGGGGGSSIGSNIIPAKLVLAA